MGQQLRSQLVKHEKSNQPLMSRIMSAKNKWRKGVGFVLILRYSFSHPNKRIEDSLHYDFNFCEEIVIALKKSHIMQMWVYLSCHKLRIMKCLFRIHKSYIMIWLLRMGLHKKGRSRLKSLIQHFSISFLIGNLRKLSQS